MAIARRLLVDPDRSGFYHCITRCVRQAFLCGADRKQWIHDRLIELVQIFAIDTAAFALLDNHLHLVLRTAPEIARGWADQEVAARWYRLFPKSVARWVGEGAVANLGEEEREKELIRLLALDAPRIASLRRRLGDLSTFMKCLKEPIARRANREDDCTGHFWEGRFRSIRILDLAALLATLVYIDLNVIRAGGAMTPEGSDHTSIQDRIHVKQMVEKLWGKRKRCPRRAWGLVPGLTAETTLGGTRTPRDVEDGGWLLPIRRLLDFELESYLQIVDVTGRTLRPDKRGAIPSDLRPILERLSIEAESWVASMARTGRLFGSVAGTAASCAAEAVRRGARRVVSTFDIEIAAGG